MAKIAIVRIHGQVRNNGKRHRALILLGLEKKFSVLLAEDTPLMRSQLKTIDTDVTWGEASDEIMALLTKKSKNKILHLNPPTGGLGRKGIKMPFAKKGATGYRGAKINDLLKKMI